MARHEQRRRVACADGCRGTHRLRIAEPGGEGRVGQRFAGRDAAQRVPSGLLHLGAELAHRHGVYGCEVAVVIRVDGGRGIRLAVSDVSRAHTFGEPGDDGVGVGGPPGGEYALVAVDEESEGAVGGVDGLDESGHESSLMVVFDFFGMRTGAARHRCAVR